MENVIYRVILKRSEACKRPNVIIYYDENIENAIVEMRKYVKENGFTVYDRDGRFTISDIIISKETPTGKILCQTPYRMFFDIYGNRKIQMKERMV